MNDFSNISSYKELCETIKNNKRAVKCAEKSFLSHGTALLESLSPMELSRRLKRWLAPLSALYRLFTRL